MVAASFLLAWAAEAAQIDVSGGLAIAVLALIAVLPEYAVDLYYAYTAGHNAEYTQYAAANMTGSNRLLMGIGWPIVVLVSLYVANKVAGKRNGKRTNVLGLDPGNRVELGFLLIAGVIAFVVPADRAHPPGARRRAAGLVRSVPLQADARRRRGAGTDRRRSRDRRAARLGRGARPSSRSSSSPPPSSWPAQNRSPRA